MNKLDCMQLENKWNWSLLMQWPLSNLASYSLSFLLSLGLDENTANAFKNQFKQNQHYTLFFLNLNFKRFSLQLKCSCPVKELQEEMSFVVGRCVSLVVLPFGPCSGTPGLWWAHPWPGQRDRWFEWRSTQCGPPCRPVSRVRRLPGEVFLGGTCSRIMEGQKRVFFFAGDDEWMRESVRWLLQLQCSSHWIMIFMIFFFYTYRGRQGNGCDIKTHRAIRT